MYLDEASIDRTLFLQGDILLDFNFPHIIIENGEYKIKEKKENVILLSQSCDLQIERDGNDRFVLCPIMSESQLRALFFKGGLSEIVINSKIDNMRGNKKLDMLFLQKNKNIEDSFAIFPKIMSLETKSLQSQNVSVRLSDSARHYLADRLHTYLCRAFDPLR